MAVRKDAPAHAAVNVMLMALVPTLTGDVTASFRVVFHDQFVYTSESPLLCV